MNTANPIHLKAKHVLLGLSLFSLVIAFAFMGENPFWSLGLPIGTILFGLFLIVTVLDKEMSLYDQDQRRHKSPSAPARPTDNSTFVPRGRTLVACR